MLRLMMMTLRWVIRRGRRRRKMILIMTKKCPWLPRLDHQRIGKEYPSHTKDSVQVAGPSTVPDDFLLFVPAPIPGPSILPLPQVSPKKKTSKKTQPNEIARPATHSSWNPSLTKIKVKMNEASKLAQNDQDKKSSRRHGETELVDKVSKLF
jgi:hypothetical protein